MEFSEENTTAMNTVQLYDKADALGNLAFELDSRH